MKIFILILLFMVFPSQKCNALENIEALYPETHINQAKDELTDDMIDIIDSYNIHSGEGLDSAINQLKNVMIQSVKKTIDSLWKPFVLIFMTITCCSILEPMFPNKDKCLPLLLFGTVEILYLTLSESQTIFRDGISALERLYDFSTVLLPCLAGTSVAVGASISAGVKYTAAGLFMNLLLNFSNTVLLPMISAYLVFVTGNAVFNQKIMAALSNLIRWGSKTVLTWATIIFTAYLNIAGIISSSGDLLALRITKTALMSALPVVGNILSGAATSLVAGAAIIRNSIGIFGLLSIVSILLVPFLHLGIRYFAFLVIARLADLFPNQRFSGLIDGIAGAYGMLLGAIGSGFIMIFLSFISFMQIVGG